MSKQMSFCSSTSGLSTKEMSESYLQEFIMYDVNLVVCIMTRISHAGGKLLLSGTAYCTTNDLQG